MRKVGNGPDLIWMDNLATVRTPNYYVQQLFACHAGTHVVALTEDVKEAGAKKPKAVPVTGKDGLCASAVYDQPSGKYIVKLVNVGDVPQQVQITFKGLKTLPAKESVQLTTLHSDDPMACNTVKNPNVCVPVEHTTVDVTIDKNIATLTVPARTVACYRF